MNSMTGFGRASGESAELGLGFLMEISSVNRKQLELKFSLPRELVMYESLLRARANAVLSRGSVMIRLEMSEFGDSGSADAAHGVNLRFAARLHHAVGILKQKLALASDEEAYRLLALPGIVEPASSDYTGEGIERLLTEVVDAALSALTDMRAAEGATLKNDFENRLDFLRRTLAEIEPLVKTLPEQQYARMRARLQEAGFTTGADDERMLRELVIFADRADVTEEITRLKSHFQHFGETLTRSDEPVGRTLDFMTQEMFREINTLGNKAPLPEVSVRVVAMKTELEKIREQVQNIE